MNGIHRLAACVVLTLVVVAPVAPVAARPTLTDVGPWAREIRSLVASELERPAGVVVLVRHAEKRTDEDDPRLTRRGRRRAKRLARLLGDLGVDRIVASQYRRTQRTIAPLARASGVPVTTRPAREIDALAAELARTEPGRLVVVAGHSNTVPGIARAMGAEPRAHDMSEAVYDTVLVVVVPRPGSSGPPRLHVLTFDP